MPEMCGSVRNGSSKIVGICWISACCYDRLVSSKFDSLWFVVTFQKLSGGGGLRNYDQIGGSGSHSVPSAANVLGKLCASGWAPVEEPEVDRVNDGSISIVRKPNHVETGGSFGRAVGRQS